MDTEEKQLKSTNTEKTHTNKNNKTKINNNDQSHNININNLSELQEELLDIKKKEHDIQLRHLAHIENIKKDAETEIKNIKNIKKEEFFKKFIPIVDVLENTLSLAKKVNLEKEPLVQGIKLTLESLLKIICKFGVKIEGKKNEIFNPNIHSAILTENSIKIQPDHIISVTRKGFSFNNITLRKAFVKVSKI